MFTGIIQAIGKVRQVEYADRQERRIAFDAPTFDLVTLSIGASVAVNGVCVTVVAKHSEGFVADVSPETLSCTTLGDLALGDPINLECALTLSSLLGGHLVNGHVDATGCIERRYGEARSTRFDIAFPPFLARYICRKGSICVDGVSLTVNTVADGMFSVNIIPHTMERTICAHYQIGRRVNLEVDTVARYVESLLADRPLDTDRSGRV